MFMSQGPPAQRETANLVEKSTLDILRGVDAVRYLSGRNSFDYVLIEAHEAEEWVKIPKSERVLDGDRIRRMTHDEKTRSAAAQRYLADLDRLKDIKIELAALREVHLELEALKKCPQEVNSQIVRLEREEERLYMKLKRV